ncbi:MAG: hypothetical protein JXA21_03245 [Anaerolineae bacterium]|nr:hypothetical protein [Anaerolineae bacterium]
MQKLNKVLTLLGIVTLLAVACNSEESPPAATTTPAPLTTAIATLTPFATATAPPTNTPQPTPTATPTLIPENRESATATHKSLTVTISYPKPGKASNLTLFVTHNDQVLYDDKVFPYVEVDYKLLSVPSPEFYNLDSDDEPEIVLTILSAGAYCCSETVVFDYDNTQGTIDRLSQESWGTYRNLPEFKDVDDDGVMELISHDEEFSYEFGSYASTGPSPIQIWEYSPYGLRNVTRSYPELIRQDADYWWAAYHDEDWGLARPTALAAYVADLYLLGEEMLDWSEAEEIYASTERFVKDDSWNAYRERLGDALRRHGYSHLALTTLSKHPLLYGSVLVFKTHQELGEANPEETLLFTTQDFQILSNVPLPPGKNIQLAAGYATYPDTNSEGQPGVNLVSPNGASSFAPQPESNGTLIDYALAPNGAQIAWLFDITKEGNCTPGAGCSDLAYDLMLTDALGQATQILWRYRSQDIANIRLSLDGWRRDSQTVFIHQDPRATVHPSLIRGGNILEVPLSDDAVHERGDYHTEAYETLVSHNGYWLVQRGVVSATLYVSAKGEPSFSVPYLEYPYPNIAQLAFSPKDVGLVWLEWAGADPDLAPLKVNYISYTSMLGDGSVQETFRFEPGTWSLAEMPLIGPWVGEDLLLVQHNSETWIVNVHNGQSAAWKDLVPDMIIQQTLGVLETPTPVKK